MCGCTTCHPADSPPVNILCKSLDKSKKCAIIKVRGNTGDGYFLPNRLDNRIRGSSLSGYLFLCCAMYSSKRFRANKVATKQSCKSNMSITSFLSEGEKTCSLRSREEATATVFGVSKVTDFSVALLLYTLGGGLSSLLSTAPCGERKRSPQGAVYTVLSAVRQSPIPSMWRSPVWSPRCRLSPAHRSPQEPLQIHPSLRCRCSRFLQSALRRSALP